MLCLKSCFGALSIAVIGELAGLYEAWKQHGKLPGKGQRPAEHLARKGFKISPYLYMQMDRTRLGIMADKGLHDIFTSNGTLLQQGSMCRNTKLAQTLQIIGRHGPEAFYNGSIASNLVKDVKKARGILTTRDLERYRIKVMKPISAEKQNRENNNNNNQQPGRLLRSPSLLQRVKSINLYRYKSQELNPFSSITITTLQPSELEHSQQFLDTFNIPHDDKQHIDQFPYENLDENLDENHHLPMDETYHNIEDHHSFRDDEEVDAKADDFINKFKNQLKLQRLDSILRYKEMLGRGADK
ncbi:hypothetical protein IFM89_012626 [Coptis chinensis]|uniref:Uncharacterized protein n=1 Tax=Coptis chinensis TaxID=261450 RepID=A0A835INA9_9MAGN|nr:hypothetical protein IFM89_012626 [Coptis chinensis]